MRKTPTKFRFGFAGRAHPHVCGENKGVAVLGKGMKGSSPRVRGKLIGCAGVRVDDGLIPAHAGKLYSTTPCCALRGLIPAHAGKTCPGLLAVHLETAHPRACGENSEDSKKATNFEGSSPRMRGKRAWRYPVVVVTGLIPAHAGKTKVPGAGP